MDVAAQDPRSSPLDHLMTVLPALPSLRFLLLENVCGFERSEARSLVTTALREAGFSIQEFLVSKATDRATARMPAEQGTS